MSKNFSEASGIQGFSSVASNQHYVIFAANEHPANHVSAMLTYTFRNRKAGEFTFRAMVGAYKGQTENSWLVRADDWHLVSHLCAKEESVLYLGKVNSRNQRAAMLIFLNGNRPLHECDVIQDLGHMREVSRDVALAQDGYTQGFVIDGDKLRPQYWACFHNDKFGEPVTNN